MSRLRFGIYGTNGHQLTLQALHRLDCEITACAAMAKSERPESLSGWEMVPQCRSLEELVARDDVDAVSLCSPVRRRQAKEAILALQAGKHVYAEKPCAMTEAELDNILRTARETGRKFHEMAGTSFAQPYLAMREQVLAGAIGEVVQVIVEKSYPYHPGRPQDEDVDGGLIGQCVIHALRLIEQTAGLPIRAVQSVQTTQGNPVFGGGLQMAANLALVLDKGATASVSANYLNPKGLGVWGCDSLKILGTEGFLESREGGTSSRIVIRDQPPRVLDAAAPSIDWLQAFVEEIREGKSFPLSLEQELSPTRWAIRARESNRAGRLASVSFW